MLITNRIVSYAREEGNSCRARMFTSYHHIESENRTNQPDAHHIMMTSHTGISLLPSTWMETFLDPPPTKSQEDDSLYHFHPRRILCFSETKNPELIQVKSSETRQNILWILQTRTALHRLQNSNRGHRGNHLQLQITQTITTRPAYLKIIAPWNANLQDRTPPLLPIRNTWILLKISRHLRTTLSSKT